MKKVSSMSSWKLSIIMWMKLFVIIMKATHPKRQLSLLIGSYLRRPQRERDEAQIFMEPEQMLLKVN